MDLIFAEEESPPSGNTKAVSKKPWCILLVDDDAEVHAVTRLALKGFEFQGSELELLSAHSAQAGREIFNTRDDIALAIVDVVMESDHAGLDLVHYVRNTLENHRTRLVMRTGQPGQAPEDRVIREYDIDDYKEKTDLTIQKLRTLLYSKLRSYRDVCLLQQRAAALDDQLTSAQAHLIQSEKLASIGQLAAGVAHEINNPIGYIFSNYGTLDGYLRELLGLLEAYEAAEPHCQDAVSLQQIRARKSAMDLPFVKEDIPTLMRESKEGIVRVRGIVQDLKDFSHVDALHEWQYCNLNQAIESTLNVVNNEIKYKADVVRRYGNLPEVQCMASQINQVVLNLLVNAAHAIGPERGVITVGTDSNCTHAWITVGDTGSGIAPDVLPRIFNPFFTTKPVGKGTGLGLSLSYGIVQKHNGSITVRSEPGQGSEFRVTIPLHQKEHHD